MIILLLVSVAVCLPVLALLRHVAASRWRVTP